MSVFKYILGALATVSTAILAFTSSEFFANPESYYLFMIHRFRYDAILFVVVIVAIFFSSDIISVASEFLHRRPRGVRLFYIAFSGICFVGAIWLVRYDVARYLKERAIYFEQEFDRDYSRFLTLVGDEHYFDGQFSDAVKLWNLAGGERNLEKARITEERRLLAAKIFASSSELERSIGPNIDTYLGTMQSIYLYPESEEYVDKIEWYIGELNRLFSLKCTILSPKEFWIYYGEYVNIKPSCEGGSYKAKWLLAKVTADVDLFRQRRADAAGLFALLSRSEATTLSNRGHEIVAKSFPSRVYHRLAKFDGTQDFVASGDSGSTDEGDNSSETDSETEPLGEAGRNLKGELIDADGEESLLGQGQDISTQDESSLADLKATPAFSEERLAPELSIEPVQQDGELLSFQWPANGPTRGQFGDLRPGTQTRNEGIDIGVTEGTGVHAVENAVVIYAGDGLRELGKAILLRHDSGLVTVYGYLSKLNVARGQNVSRGDVIAASGKAGLTAEAMLHFEVRKNANPVDPLLYLEGEKTQQSP